MLQPKRKYTIGVAWVQPTERCLAVLDELSKVELSRVKLLRFRLYPGSNPLSGACGLAPVIMINDGVYGRLVPSDIKGIVDKYRGR